MSILELLFLKLTRKLYASLYATRLLKEINERSWFEPENKFRFGCIKENTFTWIVFNWISRQEELSSRFLENGSKVVMRKGKETTLDDGQIRRFKTDVSVN